MPGRTTNIQLLWLYVKPKATPTTLKGLNGYSDELFFLPRDTLFFEGRLLVHSVLEMNGNRKYDFVEEELR